ncbi:hypothetical protein F5Y13DRAFT_204254 [Hypoxylon sp. FL1857]|nr:hypothetical protein F5Y13DRAFT_204254 [Hypoxylon sp. FL1857]
MRFNVSIALLAAQATGIFAAGASTASQATAAECGDLGVMKYDQAELPHDVQASDVRKCANHPLKGHERAKGQGSLAPKNAADSSHDNATIAQPRDCSYDAPYGCYEGYCWKACGDPGEWCWTARKAGFGSWYKCDTYKDCGTLTYACGKHCDSCGCSC